MDNCTLCTDLRHFNAPRIPEYHDLDELCFANVLLHEDVMISAMDILYKNSWSYEDFFVNAIKNFEKYGC